MTSLLIPKPSEEIKIHGNNTEWSRENSCFLNRWLSVAIERWCGERRLLVVEPYFRKKYFVVTMQRFFHVEVQ